MHWLMYNETETNTHIVSLYTCYELIMETYKSNDINEFIYVGETWGSLIKSTLWMNRIVQLTL